MSAAFRLYAKTDRAGVIARIATFLGRLTPERAWVVEVREHKPRRSLAQNALLWSIYTDILERGGEDLGGWTKEDLHDFFLGSHFGWQKLEGLGRARMKPLRRSSSLNKQEMTDLIEFIVRYMAERGVALELPGDTA